MTLRPLSFWACCLGFVFATLSCRNTPDAPPTAPTVDYAAVVSPQFNSDSAYSFVAAQVAFGPRVPGSAAADRCADYLVSKLSQWADTVIVQPFSSTLWDKTTVRGRNIIASFNTDNNNRVVLAAHWDSRLWADHDTDSTMWHTPILGANDGASGVGLLLEVARCIASQPLDKGVDIIFFDLEDQGVPEWSHTYVDDSWCLGSQYWATHPHQPCYSARYGILFDMVGTPQPRFTKEQISVQYASSILDNIWAAARSLGFSNIFVDQKTDPILDDHLYVNRHTSIPMADIVQHSPQGNFFPFWHTVKDDMQSVDRRTLSIVGTVTLKVLYL